MLSLTVLARRLAIAAVCATATISARPATADDPLAKVAFGAEKLPAAGPARSIGFYSKTYFHGRVKHIRRASDVTGVYGAAGGGGAIGRGAQVIVMTNDKGATLELTGEQVGLQVNADLSGMSITVK